MSLDEDITKAKLIANLRERAGLRFYTTPEELPEHLRSFAKTGEEGSFGFFQHPLWCQMWPLAVQLPIEDIIAHKEETLRGRLEAKDYEGWVFTHERFARFDALLELVDRGVWQGCTQKEARAFWQLAAHVWTDAEADESDDCWTKLLAAPIPCRSAMTKASDRKKLKAMPDPLPVFRGVHYDPDDMPLTEDLDGWQWSLSRKTAEFFAKRFLRGGMRGAVLIGEVNQADVVAYLTSRGEEEVLVPPGQVMITDMEDCFVNMAEKGKASLPTAILGGLNRRL